MYQDLIKYINGTDFSPTIFSGMLDSFFISYFDEALLDKILIEQEKKEIKELDYSILKLEEIFAVLNGIYKYNPPLAYCTEMWKMGKLGEIANRLTILDVSPKLGEFDDRKYYYFRNLIILASQESGFTQHRLILSFDGKLRFFSKKKDLSEIIIDTPVNDKKEIWKYLKALQMRHWIEIFEPEIKDYWIIYPNKRLLKLIEN